MPTIRQTFSGGLMDKDTDERLLEPGFYRHAENVNINTSEGSDEGAVEIPLSNKKLTNLYFGSNVESIGKYEDTAKLKLYWFVISDLGCWLLEFDQKNQSVVKVLSDTRPIGERVLDLKRDKSITGIAKIVNEKDEDDLLIWTDNNIEICCINIERAKTFAENGFSKEDIFLIKKPPLNPPSVQPLNLPIKTNDMEDNFFSFYYRFQYLDGEYSALSPGSKYMFHPKKFSPDYFELINKGMINQFNAVRVSFNTGEKQVVKIQVCFKKSNSNVVYLIETFTKKDEGWGDNSTENITFLNNKIYKSLPEKELYRLYDNVPKRAKALDLINNIPVLGDYTEGYDMLDRDGNKVVMDYSVGFRSYELNAGEDLNYNFNGTYFTFSSPDGIEYKEGESLFIEMGIMFEGIIVYENNFQFILPQDFNTLTELVESQDFQNLTNFINVDFQSHYNEEGQWDVNPDYDLDVEPTIVFSLVGGVPRFSVTPIVFLDTANGNVPVSIQPTFNTAIDGSPVSLSEKGGSESCKSNQSYTVGLVYREDYGRGSTVQAVDKNTLFIPQEFAERKNSIVLTINNPAPVWATNFKVAVKTAELVYHIIYVNEFFGEGLYTWVKLEDGNKDKVKSGDFLNVKMVSGIFLSTPIRVKVLDVKNQENNFISGNTGEGGEDIIESSGLYMKIRPSGFSMDQGDYETYIDSKSHKLQSAPPSISLSLFSSTSTPLALPVGSYIKVRLNSKRKYKSNGWNEVTYEREFYVQADYASIEEWMEDNITGLPHLYFERTIGGNTAPPADLANKVILTTIAGESFLKFTSPYEGNTNGAYAYIEGDIYIRIGGGMYVFETDPKQAETEVYFETPETYPIVNGNHIGKIPGFTSNQNQILDSYTPAVIELSFFNCYAQGNGVESYRIYDDFNTNFLNIDSRPNLVSTEPYREIKRQADLTYGQPYVESSNINGINEFNASTANWKELNKQDGPIQIIKSREGNLLVIQQHKWGYVLFGKDALYGADGTMNLQSVPEILGGYIPYAGLYGLSDPESFAVDGTRCYGVDKERGIVLRLSQDGLTPIVQGMKDWFRDILHKNSEAKVIGGIDPYFKRYQITIGEQPVRLLELQCDNIITKYNQNAPFTYNLKLNDLSGEVVINYNISDGEAKIEAVFNGNTYFSGEVTGVGNLTFTRNSLTENIVRVTIYPISQSISYEIGNSCPLGTELKVVSVVLNDNNDLGKTITNRYRWGSSQFFGTDDLFDEIPCSRWQVDVGIEGQGRFPNQGSIVNIQSLKDNSSSGAFNIAKCNKLSYLISSTEYNEDDVNEIVDQADALTISTILGEGSETNHGSFLFSRSNPNQILYLIWDYRDGGPVVMDDYANCNLGQSTIVNVLSNDQVESGATVSIISSPQYGSYVVNSNQTITYTHNGSSNFNDSLMYEVDQDGCKSSATVYFSIGVPCGSSLSVSGNRGIYKAILSLGTGTGICGVKFNPANIPDRCQLFYDGNLVADSLFCGGVSTILVNPGTYTYPVFEYNGSSFVSTGNTETITITSNDIDDVDTPNQPRDVVFNKTNAMPTTIELVVTGHPTNSGTAWSIGQIICPPNN
jgi:hypothetical protein